MSRIHVPQLWHAIDTKPPAVRLLVAVLALASLALFGAGVRHLGEVLALGRAVLPLLVVAYIPALIAGLALWSLARDALGAGEIAHFSGDQPISPRAEVDSRALVIPSSNGGT